MLRFLTTLLLFCVITTAQAATLTSSVNRNPTKINQTLILTVRYTDQSPSTDLDLSELKQDFEILASSPTTNTSISNVNGQTTRQTATTWTVTLAAKRDGNLTIPVFEINGERSEPISVEVSSLSAEELAQPQPIEVSLTIDDTDNLSIKPGEQIIINVVLSAANNVGNIRGQELIVDGADLESLGQQDGQRLENGISRQVAIWRYALFPNEAGEIIMPVQTFNGSIGGRTSFFDSFNRGGQAVSNRSVEQTINVEPRPTSNGQDWFPANNVSVESSWAGDTNQIRVGEPITRTITITASGQRASAIPPLVTNNTPDYKSYQDQPKLENSVSEQGIIGVRQEAQAIVPSQAGELTLAEQRISWWDNNADQWRETILPAETLTVLAGNTTSTQNTQLPQIGNASTAGNNATNLTKSPTVTSSSLSDWLWKIATILLAAIVLFQFILLRKQKVIGQTENDDLATNVRKSETLAWKDLQNSLKHQDANQIRHSIVAWTKTTTLNTKVANLDSLAALSTSKTLRGQLTALDKQLYGRGENLDSEGLELALVELRQELKSQNTRSESPTVLAPLYPT